MVASVEETESSVSSTSLGRHSAALPIVGPPRGLLARVSREEKSFSGFPHYHDICMASLAASDAAMISASQVLNATETCFLEPHDTAARPSWNTKPD